VKKVANITPKILIAVLLIATVGLYASSGVVEGLAEDGVEWTDSTGTAITHAKPHATDAVVFYIQDDALGMTKSGTRVFGDLASTAAIGTSFVIPAATVGGAAVGTTTGSSVGTYDTTTPANTPLSAWPTITIGSAGVLVTSANLDTGAFTLGSAAASGADVTAVFSYQDVDVYASSTAQRAEVVSSSDVVGEPITISEVASNSTSTSASNTNIFRGSVILSSDPADNGPGDGKVWVEDGDTVTVNYLNSDGGIVATDTLTIDAVDPAVTVTQPTTGTKTTVLNPRVEFDVTDAGSGIDKTSLVVTINSLPVSASSLASAPVLQGYTVLYASDTSWVTAYSVSDSTEFTMNISVSDAAGNSASTDVLITMDNTAPVFSGATTGSARTTVTATFSEALDGATVDAADFTVVDGTKTYAVSTAALNADTTTQVDIVLGADLDADATPTVTVAGTISDPAGNSVAAASSQAAPDGVAPALTITIDTALATLAGVVKTTVVSDERLVSGGLKVSVFGPNGAAANGTLATTAPVPLSAEGSVTIAAGDTTGQYGVTVQGSDGANTSDNLTDVADEAQTAVASVVTLANGPIGDANFDGSLNTSDITVKVGGSAVTLSSTTTIDASARTITFVNGDVAATADVTVSYGYVGTDVFEVDQTAPTVAFNPDGATAIQDTSPFIRVTFTDDAYAGDTFKDVALTTASHTPPGGTATDVLASFVTRTASSYMWATSGLALGAHSLAITGTDSAGNAVSSTLSFTIEERTYSLSLEPGWNLVSLPGSPSPSDVADVFSDAGIATVMTYDPTTTGLWSFVTRNADGTYSGAMTIEGQRGYWVETTAPVTQSVKVPGLAAGSMSPPDAYRLSAGWNLVGISTADIAGTSSRDADEYFSSLDWSRAYTYNAISKSWASVVPDASTTAGDAVTVGKGYWVYLNARGTLTP
jgi:hypothetical protein